MQESYPDPPSILSEGDVRIAVMYVACARRSQYTTKLCITSEEEQRIWDLQIGLTFSKSPSNAVFLLICLCRVQGPP